ncbi:Asp-domain-containing protein [Gyrodon lividus]|nr:Asp-domain-containing protein [Gyrodon lividus]
MRFTFATVITAWPVFIAASPQGVKQGGTAIPLALYKNSSLINADKSVNSEALKSHVASTTAKILRGLDNFERNTGVPHSSAVKDARKRGSGGEPLNDLPDNPYLWFGTISIGTPPKTYTGTDLVLPGADCDDSCNGHERYESLTSVDLGEPFIIRYVNGESAFGRQCADNVTIAGLTANGQTLGAASHYSHGLQIKQFAADGFMGMAFQALSHYNQSPVFVTLITQGQTDDPVFAFNLADRDAELYIGGTNPDMYIGDFSWAHVIQHGYWEVIMDNVLGNGQIVLTNIIAIIDTGSSLIHGNPSTVAKLYEAIGGAHQPNYLGAYTFPCDAVPIVSLTFGGTSFPIPPETFNIGTSADDPSRCMGGIVAGDFPSWVVGSVFLRHVYTAFDMRSARVGFATLA